MGESQRSILSFFSPKGPTPTPTPSTPTTTTHPTPTSTSEDDSVGEGKRRRIATGAKGVQRNPHRGTILQFAAGVDTLEREISEIVTQSKARSRKKRRVSSQNAHAAKTANILTNPVNVTSQVDEYSSIPSYEHKAINKPKFSQDSDVSTSQLYIDVGQKDIGEITCLECGMVYYPGTDKDEKAHRTFHNRVFDGLDCSNPKPDWIVITSGMLRLSLQLKPGTSKSSSSSSTDARKSISTSRSVVTTIESMLKFKGKGKDKDKGSTDAVEGEGEGEGEGGCDGDGDVKRINVPYAIVVVDIDEASTSTGGHGVDKGKSSSSSSSVNVKRALAIKAIAEREIGCEDLDSGLKLKSRSSRVFMCLVKESSASSSASVSGHSYSRASASISSKSLPLEMEKWRGYKAIACVVTSRIEYARRTKTKQNQKQKQNSAFDGDGDGYPASHTIDNDIGPILVAENHTVPCALAVSAMWTMEKYRLHGVCKKLVDAARCCAIYGCVVDRKNLAFSHPTPDGVLFARKYTGCDDFLVYP